jgi:site-specific DNA recombinase
MLLPGQQYEGIYSRTALHKIKEEEQNKWISKARELLLYDAIEPVDCKIIKSECEREVSWLEVKLTSVSSQNEDINRLFEKACKILEQLDTLYPNSTIQRRQLIGSILPEKLVFENNTYRTARITEAVRIIYSMDKAFRQKKMGQTSNFANLSHQVIPLGLEPRAHTLKVYCSTN